MNDLQTRLAHLDKLIAKASRLLLEQEFRLKRGEAAGQLSAKGHSLLMLMRQSLELLHWNRALLLYVDKYPGSRPGLRLGNEGPVTPGVLSDVCHALGESSDADVSETERMRAAEAFAVRQQQLRPSLPIYELEMQVRSRWVTGFARCLAEMRADQVVLFVEARLAYEDMRHLHPAEAARVFFIEGARGALPPAS